VFPKESNDVINPKFKIKNFSAKKNQVFPKQEKARELDERATGKIWEEESRPTRGNARDLDATLYPRHLNYFLCDL